jgi:hypothetical protein
MHTDRIEVGFRRRKVLAPLFSGKSFGEDEIHA